MKRIARAALTALAVLAVSFKRVGLQRQAVP
jgi:hypothetical protein